MLYGQLGKTGTERNKIEDGKQKSQSSGCDFCFENPSVLNAHSQSKLAALRPGKSPFFPTPFTLEKTAVTGGFSMY